MDMESLDFGDLAALNHLLAEKGTRYHIAYKNHRTACLEPPGACCLTEAMTQTALDTIRRYYRERGLAVRFSEDGLYFSLEKLS